MRILDEVSLGANFINDKIMTTNGNSNLIYARYSMEFYT